MILQYCRKCTKQLNTKMVVSSLLCRPCTNWVIAQRRKKPKPKCIDCRKNVFRNETKRCRECNTKYMRIYPTNPNGWGSMEKSPAWKGGKTKSKRGYIYIKSPKHLFSNGRGYVFEHRLIMEKFLKRYLEPNEVIHHINGIKNDNRLENLELMTQDRHMQLHNNGIR